MKTELTQEDVCQLLVKKGCKEFKCAHEKQARAFAYKRIDGPDCMTNERPPEMHIYVYEDYRNANNGVWPGSVTFNLVADACGAWVDLRLYSVPRQEVEDMLDVAYAALSSMWIAGYRDICDERERLGLLPEEDECCGNGK